MVGKLDTGGFYLENLKETVRFKLLTEQFQFESNTKELLDVRQSVYQLFNYIYHNTRILYIDFIDEKVLWKYIKYCLEKGLGFQRAIKDIKNYLFFLKYIKGSHRVPKIDFSTISVYQWM